MPLAAFSSIARKKRMPGRKVEQLIIATVGFFWCFLMWFSTAAFSPSIAAAYHLSVKDLGLLASSAIWMAPPGRIAAGWASDRFGAPRTFAAILAGCGLASIASAYTTSYQLLFAERVIVAVAGVSFVVGIQHVAQWFESREIGTAEGLYAGTGNAGAGVGALLLPRIFGTDYHSAFLWLGITALVVALWYLLRGDAARQRLARHHLRLDALYRDRADARLRDVVRFGDRDERLAAGLFHARLP
jgi:NNP family nitrate/nitrite transporter-like MFS transporter